MNRYLKAEMFRIKNYKGAIISILFLPVIIAIFFVIGGVNGGFMTTNNFDIDPLILKEFYLMVYRFAPFLLLIPAGSVINRETREKGMSKALESGISPASIYLSKFILAILWGIIFVMLMAGVISFMPILVGAKGSVLLKVFVELCKASILTLIPVLSLVALYIFLVFFIKSELIGAVVYVLIIGPIDKILFLVQKITRINGLAKLSQLVPSKLIEKLPTSFDINHTMNFFSHEVKAIPIIYGLSILYLIIILGLGIALFKKRKVEG